MASLPAAMSRGGRHGHSCAHDISGRHRPTARNTVRAGHCPARGAEEVGILNGTDVSGLAAQAQEILEAGGWPVPATDTYTVTSP